MIKMIAIDLDNTLLDNNKEISQLDIKTIKKAKENGIYIVISTGRPYNGVLPILKKLGLTSKNDYVICYNGAKIINVGLNEDIFVSTIDAKCVKRVYEESIKLNLNIHAFRENEELILIKDNPYSDVEKRINNIEGAIFDFNNIKDNDLFLKVMLVDDKLRLDDATKVISKDLKENYNMLRSSSIFLEFINKNIDKGFAVKRLCEYLNIDMKETMAIGDANNDKNMILLANIGVAMENSFEEIKEIATYITSSNLNSGVAKAINKFVFNEDIK